MFDLFHAQDDLRSYKKPIIKIVICLAIIAVLVNRNNIISIDDRTLNIVLTVVSVVIAITCIYVIYISSYELIVVRQNKKTESSDNPGKTYSYEDVVRLIKENDIIDIAISCNGSVLKIGSSSECEGDRFYDKRYYVNDTEYESFAGFLVDFSNLVLGYEINVISIDGVGQ